MVECFVVGLYVRTEREKECGKKEGERVSRSVLPATLLYPYGAAAPYGVVMAQRSFASTSRRRSD